MNEDVNESAAALPEELKDVAPVLYEDLILLQSMLPDDAQINVKCVCLRYEYGSLVMSEGIAVTPEGTPLPEEFCIVGSTPFGVVAKGTLDVVDGLGEMDSNGGKAPVSTAQLTPGSLVGAFESLDQLLDFEEAPLADWTIYSGVNCVEPTIKLATAGRHKAISKLFQSQITQHDMGKMKLFGQVVSAFGSDIPGVSEWKSELVLLNQKWHEVIYNDYDDPEVERVALRIRDWIYRATWDAISVTRNIHSASKKYFYGAGVTGRIERRQINQAYRLFEALVDLSLGRAPVFQAREVDDESSPSGAILSGFLHKVDTQCGLMQPCFLYGKKRVGYVPFPYLLPELFDGPSGQADALTKIKEGLSVILSASQRLMDDASKDATSVPLLRNFEQLVGCMQVRTAGEHGAMNHAALSYGTTVTGVPISEEEFFSHVPNPASYKQWRYFKHCLKINLNDCQWP